MIDLVAPFRPAAVEDAPLLAELVVHASEGLALYLWGKLAAPGETAWDVGRGRAAREEGSFSYRNAIMIEDRGETAGCLIGYAIADEPPPVAADLPSLFVPLQELENLAPGTWYINVLAVRPELRGRGLGTRLLRLADEIAGERGTSLIVADANCGARRLYERHGYRERARQPLTKNGWVTEAENWVLMVRPGQAG